MHVGNITGAYLPADIVARFHRLKGRKVLMVSGTDSHGTPVTIRADAENRPVEDVYKRYHDGFLELFSQAGLSYDLFTSTHTANHFKVSQSIFLALQKNGYLYTETRPQWYSPASKRFLPDRYVEGTCYLCGFENARSDQCDKCGNVLDPEKLLNPHSKVDGSTPELRDTAHFYLDLSKLEPEVADFLRKRQHYWRDTVVRQSLGQIESEGLRSRPITRDLDWGIPVPVAGWEGKCLYVWFEAVIGYLSATIEWAQLNGQADEWKNWWTNPDARAFYFIGKDNIFFHAAWWPAQLLGVGPQFLEVFNGESGQPLTLPNDVPANQFMNLEGEKISGSRNWAVWGRDFLTRYDPDPLRYYLTVNMPEMRDTDWDWEDFLKRNNDELVATWGNLANRVLSFAVKNFEGAVPEPGPLTELDEEILRTVETGFETVGAELEGVRLRSALFEAMRLATEVNRYLDQTAPWKAIKVDRQAAARAVYTALRCIDSLSILLAPFLPFTSEKVFGFFGHEGSIFGRQAVEEIQDSLTTHDVLRYYHGNSSAKWQPSQLKPGTTLHQPLPLFKKLEPTIVEEERARLGRK
ncbi:MAG: methionine--tRNA ligase [Anaerolineae bacterium]|nr:methionine--tRNA ligase [Anaerolineae bacterium]